MHPELFQLRLGPSEITLKRAEIIRRIIERSPNINSTTLTKLSAVDLELLFQLYDEVFFAGQLAAGFPGKLKFSLSTRMTKSAGKTFYPKYPDQMRPEQITAEIRMGTGFFLQFNELSGAKFVSGISATNALEAFLLVFEHEICHLIEFITYQRSNCKGKRFKTLANHLFGHTESYHRLPTQKQIAWQKYGFKIGDRVRFYYERQPLEGILYRIQQRATIMVKDPRGQYADSKGTRYTKYYVPIDRVITASSHTER